MINLEYEVRFYFPKKQLANIINQLDQIRELKKDNRLYEKTMQYDHPSEEMSFYNKEIDGRFRIRISKDNHRSKCKITWKRRLATSFKTDINQEEEFELTILPEEYDSLIFIIEEVLKMKSIESYERYRTIYANKEIEVSLDEYPFGIALEIESKNNSNPEKIIKKWVKILNLKLEEAYPLSCDDKYLELCNAQGVEVYKHITFDLPMPEVIE